jgi:hypothetical protein
VGFARQKLFSFFFNLALAFSRGMGYTIDRKTKAPIGQPPKERETRK